MSVAAVITLSVYVLATARMVRFLTEDKLTDGFREWWKKRYEYRPLRRYLIVCAWCTSIWLAAGPAVSWVVAPEHLVLKSLSAVLAFSWLSVAAHKLLHLLDAKIKLFAPPQPDIEVTDGATPV